MFILRDGLAWLFSGLPLLILVAIAWTRRHLPSDAGTSTQTRKSRYPSYP
jgi:hypothetical protein